MGERTEGLTAARALQHSGTHLSHLPPRMGLFLLQAIAQAGAAGGGQAQAAAEAVAQASASGGAQAQAAAQAVAQAAQTSEK